MTSTLCATATTALYLPRRRASIHEATTNDGCETCAHGTCARCGARHGSGGTHGGHRLVAATSDRCINMHAPSRPYPCRATTVCVAAGRRGAYPALVPGHLVGAH